MTFLHVYTRTSYDSSNHAPKAIIPRYMANELGRNAVEEMYIPQLVMRKNNVSLATEGPNLASTALKE